MIPEHATKLSGKPRNVGGIVWTPYRLGIDVHRWFDPTGDLSAGRNHGKSTYFAYVNQVGCIGRRYASLEAAFAAHIRFAKKPWRAA